MKKVTRSDVEMLKKEMPVLNEAMQRTVYGGCGGYGGNGDNWYTYDIFSNMLASGTWGGGYVEGLGYVSPETCIEGCSSGNYNPLKDGLYKGGYDLAYNAAVTGDTWGMVFCAAYATIVSLNPDGDQGLQDILVGLQMGFIDGRKAYEFHNNGGCGNY